MQDEVARKGWSFRLTPVRLFMLGTVLLAVIIIIYRMVLGLGAVTNLSDQYPWGFWIYFDVLLGVALAGGGYGIALIVHILRLDKYRGVARSAMLTSLLGYIIVVLGLLVEVGQPQNAYMPMISWGHHSVLFEVFVCISLYTVVQVLEIGSIITERVFKRFRKYFLRLMPVLLILGVTLPTLHQASLGELFAILPGKMHDLWSTPFMFVFFLLTSFAVGPAVLCLEARLAGKAYKTKPDVNLLSGLVRVSGVILAIFFVLRVGELLINDKFGRLFEGTLAANLGLLELGVGALVPIILAFSRAAKTNRGQVWFGLTAVIGVVLMRYNVSMTALQDYQKINSGGGPIYIPAWTEVTVSIGLTFIACLTYLFIVENFNILDKSEMEAANKSQKLTEDSKPGSHTLGA